MSQEIPLKVAREIGEIYLKRLTPIAEHIVFGGSIRREKPTVKDIEIVMIPKKCPSGQLTLLGESQGISYMTDAPLFSADKWLPDCTMVKGGDRYKQFALPEGMNLDLFICKPPSQWGVLFMIRTGPWQFSAKMTTPRRKGGFMPSCYKVGHGNQLWYKGKSIEAPTEARLFELYDMEYIPPKDRWEACQNPSKVRFTA